MPTKTSNGTWPRSRGSPASIFPNTTSTKAAGTAIQRTSHAGRAQYTGRTLRDIVGTGKALADIDLVGTYQEVAARLSEIIEEVGGDGFLFMNGELTRRYVTEITDGLVPELQRLGVVRKKYEHKLFRDNLMAW